MRWVTVVFVFLSCASAAANVGFKRGNNITFQRASGYASVMCYDPNDYGQFSAYCDAMFVSPTTHDSLVNTGVPIAADRVVLTATREDGSTRTKKEKFNSASQESDRFNLVTSTLTQKPLLHSGRNLVHYKFTKAGAAVAEGEFSVDVERGQPLQCETLHFSMHNNCGQLYSICDEYFYRQPRCR